MLVYTCFSAKLFCVLIIAYRSVDLAPVASVCCRSQQELDLRQEIMLLNARKTELEHNIASCPNDSLRWVTIPLSDSKVGCCDFRTKAWSYMRAPCASIYIIIEYSKIQILSNKLLQLLTFLCATKADTVVFLAYENMSAKSRPYAKT